MQPEPRRRHEHLAAVNADTEVAGQRQVGRAAIHPAVDPADRRHREIFEPIDYELERGPRGLLLCVGRAFGDRAEIVSGAERTASAGQHQHPDRRIGFDPVEQLYQRIEVIGLQAIQMLRPVEADGGACAHDIKQRHARGIAAARLH